MCDLLYVIQPKHLNRCLERHQTHHVAAGTTIVALVRGTTRAFEVVSKRTSCSHLADLVDLKYSKVCDNERRPSYDL